jgi:hypothetical protein
MRLDICSCRPARIDAATGDSLVVAMRRTTGAAISRLHEHSPGNVGDGDARPCPHEHSPGMLAVSMRGHVPPARAFPRGMSAVSMRGHVPPARAFPGECRQWRLSRARGVGDRFAKLATGPQGASIVEGRLPARITATYYTSVLEASSRCRFHLTRVFAARDRLQRSEMRRAAFLAGFARCGAQSARASQAQELARSRAAGCRAGAASGRGVAYSCVARPSRGGRGERWEGGGSARDRSAVSAAGNGDEADRSPQPASLQDRDHRRRSHARQASVAPGSAGSLGDRSRRGRDHQPCDRRSARPDARAQSGLHRSTEAKDIYECGMH